MLYKQDLKKDLREKATNKRISRVEANRLYIRGLAGILEHIYRGDLPFPEKANRLGGEVLATMGQVMYLYTNDWKEGI